MLPITLLCVGTVPICSTYYHDAHGPGRERAVRVNIGAKAALSALTREMAAEFAHLGVRVNAVAPGEIETAMLSPETEALVPRIPLHRLGVPADVAGAIYYLCSDDSAYVTGTEILVTGGQHVF